MEKDFWQERWEGGQIGFHQADTNPMLERFWPQLGVTAGRVLVPLCGKSLDLAWLAARGHEVVGVEFVPTAVAAYFEERGVVPVRREVGGFPVVAAEGVTLVVGDFFRVDTEVTGRCDAVYDRAAWVALAPQDRDQYARQLCELLQPRARLLLVNFEHDTGSGPPFSIDKDEVRATFREFSLELRHERDILDEEPRFRERGATYFREQVWLGTRLA
jgi:thiopurine S-methyltransferase